jgi:P-type Cu2+ transporter
VSDAVLRVPTVSCMSCAAKIEDALEALPGIHAADVDLEVKQVAVNYDTGAVTPSGIVAVLDELGYEATPVTGKPA